MLRYVIIFHLVVSLFASPAFASNDLSDILDGIQNKYGHLPGLSVTYSREVITRSMSMLGGQVKGDLATGRIYFKPSHYMRLEQETPKFETIIYNGDTLWWYIPDKKCVYKYPAQQFGQELRFLSNVFGGLGKVAEGFKVSIIDQKDTGEFLVKLRPDPSWENIDYMVLTLTSSNDIQGVDIHNQLGSITRFKLEKLTPKEKFEKGFFQFVVPKDVQLVEQGEQ